MAKIIARLQGQVISELSLEPDQEYTVGRSESCDLVLPVSDTISRKHFKIFSNGISCFQVEVLSRFGELYFNGEKQASFLLTENCTFTAPPFEFEFSKSEDKELKQEKIEQTEDEISDLSDRTFVGRMPLVPYLKLFNQDKEELQSFRLEGEAWVAGRDTSCSIFIDNSSISRRQFEIIREQDSYSIRDLNSANGTSLNGQKISTDTWTSLKSGDVIQIINWTLHFELRDSQFEQRLEAASSYIQAPAIYQVKSNELETHSQPVHSTNDFVSEPFEYEIAEREPLKKNWIRYATIAIILLSGVYYFIDSGTQSQPQSNLTSQKGNLFAKLPQEQQQFVKQTHKLAKELFMQGKYEMARQEIAKISQFIPQYEDSKEIEASAQQAILLKQDSERLDRKESEKKEIEEKIRNQIVICKTKINPKVNEQEIDECLSPVIQFNPEHPAIVALKLEVDKIVTERNINEEKKIEYRSQTKRHERLFEKAINLSKSGKNFEALKVFEEVVTSKLPDPNNLKGQAQTEIAVIQKKLLEQQIELEKNAEEAYKTGDIKQSLLTLRKAVEINPDNEVMKGRMNSRLVELKKQMQTFYQEGILEESVGEVESAKVKWKKILEQSLPEEEYYKKATIKLKKYGAI